MVGIHWEKLVKIAEAQFCLQVYYCCYFGKTKEVLQVHWRLGHVFEWVSEAVGKGAPSPDISLRRLHHLFSLVPAAALLHAMQER